MSEKIPSARLFLRVLGRDLLPSLLRQFSFSFKSAANGLLREARVALVTSFDESEPTLDANKGFMRALGFGG